MNNELIKQTRKLVQQYAYSSISGKNALSFIADRLSQEAKSLMLYTDFDGQKTSYWVRWTNCFQKINGAWYITHDHVSVPLDLKTGRGVLNIEP